MNYSEMSDFAINAAVGCATGEAKNSEPAFNLVIRNADGKKFDPCNSWADAGPIILTNKITISAPMEYDQPAEWLAYPASDSDICVSHPNPLRAAMTAFLVMQEAK